MTRPFLFTSALILSLCGCAGGGTEIGSSSSPTLMPTPTPAPTPTPTPTPSPPIAPAHLGLVSAAPFAVLGVGDTYKTDPSGSRATQLTAPTPQDVHFSYDAATNNYQISVPGFQTGTFTNTSYGGSAGQPATSSGSYVTAGASTTLQPLFVYLPVPGTSHSPYTYTSFGTWDAKTGTDSGGDILRADGIFAYGIATAANNVPLTGTANYTADVRGSIGADWMGYLSGAAILTFDFGAGKLSGSMHAGIFDTFDGIIMDFGKYDFTQTVYSSGSTTFSGKFVVPGLPNADSSFAGVLTGPGAAELMARFQAPYLFNGQQGTMFGVWVGKKD